MTYLGIDLGTSSVKVVAVEPDGRVAAVASAPYPTLRQSPGAAEQNPEEWWLATGAAVRMLPSGIRASVTAIGLSGQMHGTVCLDRVLTPVRPAIIWADVRSAGTARDLTRRISPARLADVIGTPLAAGFQAVTLEWLRRSEPEAFANTAKVLLPKDYLRLRLTGEIATEPSDAASTGLLEVRQRRWSAEILEAIGLKEDCLPPINRSTAITGYLTAEAQSHLKIQRPVPVCGGGADAPLAALASGVSGPGQVMLTLSSGAQATSFVDTPNVDPGLRTHTFASPLDPEQGECGWYVMGATMAAGTAVQWLTTNLLGRPDTPVDAVLDLGSTIDAGAGGLIFVPYLAGERTPHMDATARGAFIGMTANHDQRHLIRAVLEGTVFALRDAFDLVVALTSDPGEVVVAGGGAKSPLWMQILADVLGRPVRTSTGADQSAVGAAVLAAAAETGRPASAIGQEWATFGDAVEPIAGNVRRYADLREVYLAYYPAFADHFGTLGRSPGPG